MSDDDDNDYWGGYMTEWLFRDIKIKSRAEFEEDFDGIKELIAAKTLFMVDDKISMFEEVPFFWETSVKSCNLTSLSFLRRRHSHLHKANMSVTSSAFGIQLLILTCPFTEFLDLLQWQKPVLKISTESGRANLWTNILWMLQEKGKFDIFSRWP